MIASLSGGQHLANDLIRLGMSRALIERGFPLWRHVRLRRSHAIRSGTSKCIERDFKVSAAVIFLRRQPTSCDIDLQSCQHQIGQWQESIALRAELDKRGLVVIFYMRIVNLLRRNGAFPTSFPAVWAVVMAGEQARVVRQL
jgi:hypothetical protein